MGISLDNDEPFWQSFSYLVLYPTCMAYPCIMAVWARVFGNLCIDKKRDEGGWFQNVSNHPI